MGWDDLAIRPIVRFRESRIELIERGCGGKHARSPYEDGRCADCDRIPIARAAAYTGEILTGVYSIMIRHLSIVLLFAMPAVLRAADPVPAVDPYDQSKVPLEVEPPADFKGKRILIIAGKASHGPGDHEFFAGSAIVMNLLKQTDGVWPILARDGWPKNEKLFDTADTIVMYMDGGGGHPAIKPERMAIIQKQIARGAGWVNMHYAVEYPVAPGKTVLNWMGGYYETGYSINPHWDAEVRSLPMHAITRGVKPFTVRDEWYYNMRFVADMKSITPILEAIPPDNSRGTPATKLSAGRIETLAWAYDRADGGAGVRVHWRALPQELG